MQNKPKNLEEHPERPLECSECKKPITTHYTEIVGNVFTRIGMCAECPQLQRRLQGAAREPALSLIGEGKTGFVCGECGTTLDSIRVGHLVGCGHCYDIFGEFIVEEMLKSNKISVRITKKRTTGPLHVGRSPGEIQEIGPSLRLIALNEALEETLKREDYEQAAWLRDQIKEITDGTEDANGQKDG